MSNKPTTYWSDDAIQYTRLLAEIFSHMEFYGSTIEIDSRALCNSMDLSREELLSIFHRAEHDFEQIKEDLKQEVPLCH